MRMQHWSRWVCAIVVNAACVVAAQAQDPYYGVYGDAIDRTSATVIPASYGAQPSSPGGFPGYSTDHGAYPVAPWPGVSPFDASFDQTYNEDGLWFNRRNRRQREWFFGVEYFSAKLKRPNAGVVGAKAEDIESAKNSAFSNGFQNRLTAYDTIGRELAGAPETISTKSEDGNGDPFQTRSDDVFGNDQERPGLRVRWGFTNPDDSGFEILGFYAARNEESRTFRDGAIDRRPNQSSSAGEGAFDTFVFDADGEAVLIAASLFPDNNRLVFDDGFEINFESSAWGAEANFITTPIGAGTIDSYGNFHALFGVRYLGIFEEFGVRASDSGFSAPFVDGAGRAFLITPHTSRIDSKLTSHLVGPQVGLRWTLGGDSVKVTAEVKGAVAVNFEKRELQADQYGLSTTPQSFLTPADPTSGRFEEDGTEVSPILDASIKAELPVMRYLPVINKLPIARDGVFSIGYSFTQAWRIARAAHSIEYTAPLPRITTDRDTFHVRGLTTGFTWVH